MAEASPLCLALLQRLRQDALDAMNALARARGSVAPPLTQDDIVSWTLSAEDLCAFIDQAHADIETEGGVPPLHLVDQAGHDAEMLGVYRAVVAHDPGLTAAVSKEFSARLARQAETVRPPEGGSRG